ncbi:MAG: patatin-like phospholipase family protein [Marmoricola sp.]
MTRAFVLSGGGNLGAVQVGMLLALAEAGIRPDVLVGTSAGALNAVHLAERGVSGASVEALARVWASLRGRALFRPDPRSVLAGGTLCSDRGIRALLERHLGLGRLEDAAIPVHVVATDLLSGEEVDLDRGPAVEAVLASCAIPGVLPAVPWDGRALVDGGLADNAAISVAVAAGADEVVVLPAGYACALPVAPTGIVGPLFHALSLLTHQRLVADVVTYRDRVDLTVLLPPCPLSVPPLDFSRSTDLVERARAGARRQLAHDGGRRPRPDSDLALHAHPEDAPRPVAAG